MTSPKILSVSAGRIDGPITKKGPHSGEPRWTACGIATLDDGTMQVLQPMEDGRVVLHSEKYPPVHRDPEGRWVRSEPAVGQDATSIVETWDAIAALADVMKAVAASAKDGLTYLGEGEYGADDNMVQVDRGALMIAGDMVRKLARRES